MSVQPSVHEVLVGEATGLQRGEVGEPLAAASPAPSEANHSGSIGWLLRMSIDDGVRWNTNSSPESRASAGMHCTAVAPVPMMPTRLSARLVIGAPVGSPPV